MIFIPRRASRFTLAALFVLGTIISLLQLPRAMDSLGYISGLVSDKPVDWSRFAYTQYATNTEYLCNSVMLFETLHRLGSRADRLLMYASDYSIANDNGSTESQLLRMARDKFGAKLQAIKVERRNVKDCETCPFLRYYGTEHELSNLWQKFKELMIETATWAESFTKLQAFNQTNYDRVLVLDSDSTILRTMDELFLIPPCPVALPRAYWLDPTDRVLASHIMLIQPSRFEFDRVLNATSNAGSDTYDMEIMNNLYKENAAVLPHRRYALLTGEFRANTHHAYLGNSVENWDPVKVFNETKFIHFSDWPIPKPWVYAPSKLVEENQPPCESRTSGPEEVCSARSIWRGLYDDFQRRRQEICGLQLMGAEAYV